MPGPTVSAQRAGAGRLDVDPLLAVVEGAVDREAGAHDDVDQAFERPPVEVAARRRDRRRSSTSRRSEVTCTCSAPPTSSRAVQVGERERHPLGRDVHVALVRPRRRRARRAGTATPRDRRRRAARPARSSGTRSSIALAASPAIAGAPRPGGVPARPARRGRAGTRPSGTRAANAASDSGMRADLLLDPLLRPAARTRRRCSRSTTGKNGRRDLGSLPGTVADRRRRPARVRPARCAGVAPIGRAVGRRDGRGVLRGGPGRRSRLVERRRVLRRRAVRRAPTIPTPTRAWPGGCCSTRCGPRAIHSMYQPVAIEEAARRYDALRPRRRRRSTSCTSGSVPTATPRRCSREARRSTRRERLVVPAGDDAHPHPRLTFTFPAIARARLVVVTVAGAEKRDAIERIRAGEDLPGSPNPRRTRALAGRPGRAGRAVRSRPMTSAGAVPGRCSSAPLAELMARGRARRDAQFGHAGHVLAEGVRAAHDAVSRPLRLLHVREGAGPRRRAVPHARRRARDRAPRRRARLLRGAVHARRGARGAVPAGRRVARGPRLRRPPSTTSSRPRSSCSTRPACSRTRTRARSPQAELERLRAVSPSQGMMIETLAGAPRRAGRSAPRRARQDARTAPRHARSRRPRARSVHDRHPRRASARRAPSASTRSSRSPTSHRRHGHVQEVIVQNFLPKPGTAMHRRRPCPPDEFLWSIAVARLAPARRRAPPGAAEPERRPRAAARGRASTTGAASRRSPSTT